MFKQTKQTKIISVSLSPKVEDRLEKFAEKKGKSRSSVVGDALQYYFLRQEFNLLQRELSIRGSMLGVFKEQDVDRLIHSVRE